VSNDYTQSWRDIHDLCKIISNSIKLQNEKVGNIIALSRGGLVPATVLAHELDIDRIYSLGVKSYTTSRKKREPVMYQQLTKTDIWTLKSSTGCTLIVDDICDTGETFLFLRKNICKEIDNTRFVSLILKPKSKITPRYFAEKSYKWIVYPWELNNSK